MCPWYLDYIMNKKYKDFDDVQPVGKTAQMIKAVGLTTIPETIARFTPIDLFNFGDATMAHEVRAPF